MLRIGRSFSIAFRLKFSFMRVLKNRLMHLMLDLYDITRKEWIVLRPLQISPETAVKLSKALNVPIEHLMHMPQHILVAKLAELSAKERETEGSENKGN